MLCLIIAFVLLRICSRQSKYLELLPFAVINNNVNQCFGLWELVKYKPILHNSYKVGVQAERSMRLWVTEMLYIATVAVAGSVRSFVDSLILIVRQTHRHYRCDHITARQSAHYAPPSASLPGRQTAIKPA